jgi:protocatechuate 3,4-dioxygenase beta subunit
MSARAWLLLVLIGAPNGAAALHDQLRGLSPAEKAEFPKVVRLSILKTTEDVLGEAKPAASVDAQRRELQRRIMAKGTSLPIESTPGATSAERNRVLSTTGGFLDELALEVDRLAKGSRDEAEFLRGVERVRGHVRAWANEAAADRALKPLALATAPGGRLAPTPGNAQGPFYVPDAPSRGTLLPAGHAGRVLALSGRVRDVTGDEVPGALIEVWHAGSDGRHGLRARLTSDVHGVYAFTSELPGRHSQAQGEPGCRHIHFKVSAPGRAPLVSPLFFEADRCADSDPYWKPAAAIALESVDGSDRGTFDLVLSERRGRR